MNLMTAIETKQDKTEKNTNKLWNQFEYVLRGMKLDSIKKEGGRNI